MVQLDKTQKMSLEDWKVIREMFIVVLIVSIMTFIIYSLGLKRDIKCIDGVVMYHSGDMLRAVIPIIPMTKEFIKCTFPFTEEGGHYESS